MHSQDLQGLQLDTFRLPISTVSLSKSEAGVVEPWLIKGLASSPSEDRQGEIVLVKGLDLTYLDQGYGTFNWNHFGDKDPSSVVGLIKEYSRTLEGELFVSGRLLKSLPKAQHVWNLLKALEEEGETRRMGMSVEGKVLHRHNKVIYKAWVKAVALTMDPVNPDTYVQFAKSFSGAEMAPAEESPLGTLDIVSLERALTVAGSTSGSATGGSILSPEDIEGAMKDEDYASDEHPKGCRCTDCHSGGHKGHEKISKGMTFTEAVALIKSLVPTVTTDVAEGIVEFAFRTQGV